MEVRIRKLKKEYKTLRLFAQILSATEYYGQMYKDAKDMEADWTPVLLDAIVSLGTSYGAYVGRGTLVGFHIMFPLYRVGNDVLTWLFGFDGVFRELVDRNRDATYLLGTGVRPDYQGRGLSRMFFNQCMKDNVHYVGDVLEDKLVRLLERAGFRKEELDLYGTDNKKTLWWVDRPAKE